MPNGTIYPFTGNSESLLIENGRIIDPANNIDTVGSVAVSNGTILAVGEIPADFKAGRTIDAEGCWITPGFLDLNVHLREPGREDKETIDTGTAAAAAGGFTAIAAMPDAEPVTDSQSKIRYIKYRSENSPCRVYPVGAITLGLKGEELAPYGEMIEAGAKAVSGAGKAVKHSAMLKNAMNYSRNFDLPILAHCEDRDLAGKGAMNESSLSSYMGLPGKPYAAEDIDVARHIALAQYTGAKLHICHVSTKGAVNQIRLAKESGMSITAETAPHYFSYTEEDLGNYNNNRKVNPPLRQEADREAIIAGLKDGTIDAIASDHAPHTIEEKTGEFDFAKFGASGLETSLAASITNLVKPGHLTPSELVQRLSTTPHEILGVTGGTLTAGAPANITVLDPEKEWKVDVNQFHSKGKNSAFADETLSGVVNYTILKGQIVFER